MRRITRRRSPPPLSPSFYPTQKEKITAAEEIVQDRCFRIDREGRWFYHGMAIVRKEMVCLLAATLNRQPDGRYTVDSPMVCGDVVVEDAPFVIDDVFIGTVAGRQSISMATNVDQIVILEDGVMLRSDVDRHSGFPVLYVTLLGGFEARLSLAACRSLALAACDEMKDGVPLYGVWSEGVFFALPRMTGLIGPIHDA